MENMASSGIKGLTSNRSGYGQQPPNVASQDKIQYYTDEEAPTDAVGNKRHWFGRPSLKGYK